MFMFCTYSECGAGLCTICYFIATLTANFNVHQVWFILNMTDLEADFYSLLLSVHTELLHFTKA